MVEVAQIPPLPPSWASKQQEIKNQQNAEKDLIIKSVIDWFDTNKDHLQVQLIRKAKRGTGCVLTVYIPPGPQTVFMRWPSFGELKYTLPMPHRYLTIQISRYSSKYYIFKIIECVFSLSKIKSTTNLEEECIGSFLPNSSGRAFCEGYSQILLVRAKITDKLIQEKFEESLTSFFQTFYNSDYANSVYKYSRAIHIILSNMKAEDYYSRSLKQAILNAAQANKDKKNSYREDLSDYLNNFQEIYKYLEAHPDFWTDIKGSDYLPGNNIHYRYAHRFQYDFSRIKSSTLNKIGTAS